MRDHPDYAPFFKMLRMGVPMQAVQLKVSQAGLNGALMENPDAPATAASASRRPALEDAPAPAASAPSQPAAAAAAAEAPPPPPPPSGPPPEYERFLKMLKMGVPGGAVAAKCAAEGLNPAVIGL